MESPVQWFTLKFRFVFLSDASEKQPWALPNSPPSRDADLGTIMEKMKVRGPGIKEN